MLCLQQSDACKRLREKNIAEQGAKLSTHYGNFECLPEDLLYHQVLLRCDCMIIQINCSLFMLVTGYTSDHILNEGFESKPTKPICCLQGYTVFDFEEHQHHIEQMPSFIWYSLIREMIHIPSSYWSYLKGS